MTGFLKIQSLMQIGEVFPFINVELKRMKCSVKLFIHHTHRLLFCFFKETPTKMKIIIRTLPTSDLSTLLMLIHRW